MFTHVLSSLISGKLLCRPWDIVEYGICCVEDMLAEIPATTVTVSIVLTQSIQTDRPEQTVYMPASVAQLDAPSDWRPGGRGFNPH